MPELGYNNIFLSGSSGVGKTSIMQALKDSDKRVRSVKLTARDVNAQFPDISFTDREKNMNLLITVQRAMHTQFLDQIQTALDSRKSGEILVFERSMFCPVSNLMGFASFMLKKKTLAVDERERYIQESHHQAQEAKLFFLERCNGHVGQQSILIYLPRPPVDVVYDTDNGARPRFEIACATDRAMKSLFDLYEGQFAQRHKDDSNYPTMQHMPRMDISALIKRVQAVTLRPR